MTEKLFDAALGTGAPWCAAGADFDAQARTLTIRVDFAPGSRTAHAWVYEQPLREVRRVIVLIAGKLDFRVLNPGTPHQERNARSNGALRCGAITPLNPYGAKWHSRHDVTFLAFTLQKSSYVLPCGKQGRFDRHSRPGPTPVPRL